MEDTSFKFPLFKFMFGKKVSETDITDEKVKKLLYNLTKKVEGVANHFEKYASVVEDKELLLLVPVFKAKLRELKLWLVFVSLSLEKVSNATLTSYVDKIEKIGFRGQNISRSLPNQGRKAKFRY